MKTFDWNEKNLTMKLQRHAVTQVLATFGFQITILKNCDLQKSVNKLYLVNKQVKSYFKITNFV